MSRGGAREGSGRKAGKPYPLSPDAADRIRSLIQTKSIIQRLTRAIDGEIDMPSQAVTAALGLLRKVLPDLSQAEIKGDVTHRYVARVPEKAKDVSEWERLHDPQSQTLQ